MNGFLVTSTRYLHFLVAVYGLERRLRRRGDADCKNCSLAPDVLEMVKFKP